jgi:Rad3-related DNA helicase/serine/threonine protein kinase
MANVELQRVGTYSLTEVLRVSSTSTSYLSKQPHKKDCIVKRLNIPFPNNEAKEAFLVHANRLKKLGNRNILRVSDFGLDGDYGYLVTEAINGEPLHQFMPVGKLYKAADLRILISHVTDGLQYAHTHHVIHGNLCPATILAKSTHEFVLTDFSLSLPACELVRDDLEFAIPYMAPEQLAGQPSAASDQYALAVIAYELLCARRPYNASERDLLLAQQRNGTMPAPRELNPALSEAVEQILLQALAYRPEDRFPRVQDFAKSYLNALLGLPTIPSLPTHTHSASTTPSAGRVNKHEPSAQANSDEKIIALPQHSPAAETPLKQPVKPAPIIQFPATPTPKPAASSQQEILNEEAETFEDETDVIFDTDTPPATGETAAGTARLHRLIHADLQQGGILSRRLPGYEERRAQIEMAEVVARSVTEGTPAIIEAGTGTGKALDVDTPIPTPDGWKRMGDLVLGDFVFDEKGHPTRVIEAFDVMYNHPCYEVVFSDGSSIVADAEHEWVSYTCADRKQAKQVKISTYLARDLSEQRRDGRAYTLVTTEQMAATLTISAGGRANHAIPVAGPLVLPDVDLPIKPYFLGVWLGDGSSRNNQITTVDPELTPEIEKDGYTVRSLQSHPYLYVDNENGKATSRWQPGMAGCLHTLNLYRNKHIPAQYLRASERQRRDLLAGLLDTAGTVSPHGTVEFTTISPQLAQDVYELACSLGFRPSLRSGRARLNGKDCDPKWTLAFTTDQPVFRLQRKALAHKERLRNYNPERNRFRYVVAVREVPSRPVRCIQVEAASHLYLAGRAMVPTHNSLAYLVPIVRSGKVAIISTANKALQEQLFYKDIPFVQKHIKRFEAALVKGVNNYVCLDRVESERVGMFYHTKNEQFKRLLELIGDEEANFNGDFETLDFQLPPDIRGRIATDSDQCAWNKCGFFGQCYVRQMRIRAEEAQIIVVNHTLLLLDAAIGGFLLPSRDLIVLDEAHHLEEEATRAFTITINPNQIQLLLAQKLLKAHSQLSLQAETERAAQEAWLQLSQVADPGYKGRANLEEPLQAGLHLANTLTNLADSLRKQRPKDMSEKDDQLYDKLLKRTQNLAENVRTVFSVADNTRYVYYVERVQMPGQRGNLLQVSAAPLNVTSFLKERLFDKCNVICTSATLATVDASPARPEERGPNFTYYKRRIGLADRSDVIERILPLAFDYEQNALLYLPRNLPAPAFGADADDYMKAIAREMYRLVKLSRGRAFLLFSSKRMLERAYELMSPHLSYPLLKQGDMTRLELTRRFRTEEGAILFGLKSFWEGVDIAGDALSLVVIDKLPFDPPDDPVHEARVAQMKAAGENWFGTYVLPQAVLRLKQGLGRLLRTREDRGVMAILDTRLHTKGYGKLVLDALPPARRTSNIRDVERFFAQ